MSGPGVTLSASAAVMKSSRVFVSGRLMRRSLRDDLHVAELTLSHGGVVAERRANEVGPPQRLRIAIPIAIELRPGALVKRLRPVDRVGGLYAFPSHPPSPDLRVKHFVGPVVIVEMRR